MKLLNDIILKKNYLILNNLNEFNEYFLTGKDVQSQNPVVLSTFYDNTCSFSLEGFI